MEIKNNDFFYFKGIIKTNIKITKTNIKTFILERLKTNK